MEEGHDSSQALKSGVPSQGGKITDAHTRTEYLKEKGFKGGRREGNEEKAGSLSGHLLCEKELKSQQGDEWVSYLNRKNRRKTTKKESHDGKSYRGVILANGKCSNPGRI